MSCSQENTFLTNENGLKLFCKYWSNNEDGIKPRALLFIAHGISEYCLSYDEVATMLCKEGFYVFSHDHQGHGRSDGTRCLINDVREYVRDVFMHIDKVKAEFPDLPVFILGHSMGGAISVMSVIDRPAYFKGVVLIGPLIIPAQDSVGPVRIFFGKIAARICPQLPVLTLKSADMTRDVSVCKQYEDDPLNYHGGLKAGTGLALLNATQEIESKLDTIDVPFFVVHGGRDAVVCPEGSKLLYERAASKDKTLKMFDDCFHQIHKELEPNKTELLEDIRTWLSTRI